jgi:preprotein translocase subunit SecG
MQLVFLVIQIILAVAIIGTVLLQRGSGDGLGSLGGGGISGNNIISGRASASFLSKATTFLMLTFMVNSLILGNLSTRRHSTKSVVEKIESQIKQEKEEKPQAPTNE